MPIIPLQKGRFLTFPSPSQDARRHKWTFQNMTGEDWTAVTVRTGPSSVLGTLYELTGGTGDPPNIIDYEIKSPSNLSGGSPDTESLRDFFRPVEEGQTVSIRLDFDKAFESPEYIDIVFFYRDEDNVIVTVPGTIVEGIALPRPDSGATTDIIGTGASFGFASARDSTWNQAAGTLLATRRLENEVRDLRRQLLQVSALRPRTLDDRPLATADVRRDGRNGSIPILT